MDDKREKQVNDNPQTERETVDHELSLEVCVECGQPLVLPSAWIPLCPTCEFFLNIGFPDSP